MARVATALLAAGFVLVAWALSWFVVEGLLAAEARGQLRAYVAGDSPWHWRFDRRDAVVLPGSHGLGARDIGDRGIVLTLGHEAVDISLALGGRAVPVDVLQRARLQARASADVSVALLAAAGDGEPAQTLAQATLRAGETAPLALDIDPAEAAPQRVLRLRIEGVAGTELALRALTLLPGGAAPHAVCRGAADVGATLARCDDPVAVVMPPPFATVESLLLWRDHLLAAAPASVIVPRHAVPGRASLYARAGNAAWAWLAVLVAAVALLRPLLARRRDRPAGPWFWLLPTTLLLALGFPGDSTPVPVAIAFGLLLLAAALTPAAADWHWRLFGDARAWRAAGLFTALAMLLPVAAAVLNIGEGGQLRLPAQPGPTLSRYLAWAALQQALLLHAITGPLQARHGASRAVVLAGIAFALLHTPNFALMLFTLLAGSAWAALALRHRALAPLVASHFVLGTALIVATPPWLLRSAEVGGRLVMLPGW